jgi:hypothetical protein
MKATNVTAMVARVLTIGMLAGAFVMAAPAMAQQQGYRGVGYRHGSDGWRGGEDRFRGHAAEPRREFRGHDGGGRGSEWGRGHDGRGFGHDHDRGYGYR